MNKSQFNKYVRASLTKRYKDSKIEDANELIEVFIESITNALEENDEILFVGFGRFTKTHVKSRTGRNPKTGAEITIPEYYQPRFKAGVNIKEACNKLLNSKS